MILAEIANAAASDDASLVGWITLASAVASPVVSAAIAIFVMGRKQGAKEKGLSTTLATIENTLAEKKKQDEIQRDERKTRDERIEVSLGELKRQDSLVERAISEVAENMQQVVARMEDLDRRTHDHDVKLAKLESTLAGIAQLASDIAGIRSDVSALRTDVGRVQGVLEGQGASPRGGSKPRVVR